VSKTNIYISFHPKKNIYISLQQTATHWNTIRRNTFMHYYRNLKLSRQKIFTSRFFQKTIPLTAAHRNTLLHTATHCNTLQHTAAPPGENPRDFDVSFHQKKTYTSICKWALFIARGHGSAKSCLCVQNAHRCVGCSVCCSVCCVVRCCVLVQDTHTDMCVVVGVTVCVAVFVQMCAPKHTGCSHYNTQ